MPVYFIRTAETGVIKIGHSEDPKGRLRDLQVGHHEKLSMIRVLDGGPLSEAAVHMEFKKNHIRGEWFKWDDRMMSFEPDLSDGIELFRISKVADNVFLGPPDPPDSCYPHKVLALRYHKRQWPAFRDWLAADKWNCARLSAALCIPPHAVFHWEAYPRQSPFEAALSFVSSFSGIPPQELRPDLFQIPAPAREAVSS